MIAYIKGELAGTTVDTIWVETQGVAYEIYVPASIYDMLPSVGSDVKVYTYLNVREDAMQLYGFLTRDELDIFKLLITVNGIGPKGALGILSAISVDELRFAILADDAKTIAKAPGIGAKTASKLILELKDKLHLEDAFEKKYEKTVAASAAGSALGDIKREAVEALEALGYSATESLQAVQRVELREDMDTEELLKLALKEMMR